MHHFHTVMYHTNGREPLSHLLLKEVQEQTLLVLHQYYFISWTRFRKHQPKLKIMKGKYLMYVYVLLRGVHLCLWKIHFMI